MKKSVIQEYILWISVILFAITAVTFVIQIYHKSKNVAENNPLPEVSVLKNNVEVVKTPQGTYKISLDQTLKVDYAKTITLKIKDEEGNVICTCYYKKNGLVCENPCNIIS